MNEQQIKIQAADNILKKGVRVPLVAAPLLFRIFGAKTRSVVLRQPSLGGLLIIGRNIVEMGLSPEHFRDLSIAEAYRIVHLHGQKAIEIVAVSILRYPPLMWLYKRYARWLRDRIDPSYFALAFQIVVNFGGVEAFIDSIRLITELPDILSPRTQGSLEDGLPDSIAPGE